MNISSGIIYPERQVGLADLCITANMSAKYIIELVEYNVLLPISGNAPHEWQFTVDAVMLVSKAARLHRDLEIDWADISLVLNLLDDINQLKNENRQLKQQIARLSAFSN